MSPIHEDDLRAALRNDPHHPVDAHALAAEVTARGRRVRRRRRVIGAPAPPPQRQWSWSPSTR